MATQPPAPISSAFPAPPPFYKFFTPANLSFLAAHEAEDPFSQILPPELSNLVPPLPPQDGKYRSFGIQHDLSNPIVPEQEPQTPPSPRRLLSITHNILLTFLSLVHALAKEPATYAPVWDQLHALFQDAHRVVNDYRPHQARETLIAMMEEQVARAREEGRRARSMGEKVRGVLEELGRGANGNDLGREEEGDGEGEERRLWEVLDREVGFV